jgi:agmatinase
MGRGRERAGDVPESAGPEMDLAGLAPWAGLAGAPVDLARVIVVGVPYDGSAVYRRGAARAPAELRRLSAALPPADERGRSLRHLAVHDLGDLSLGEAVERGWGSVADRLTALPGEAFLTVLGGDHTVAVPVLAAQARRHPDLAVLWVDAHPDLCDSSRGGRWTCGCALRRALGTAGLDPARVRLAGCRDFDPEEVELVAVRRIPLATAAELAADLPCAAGRLLAGLGGRPLHVSFDIDALDPAHAPGTEIASAGGLSTRQALDLLGLAARAGRLVGLDVCEVSPPHDHADITSLAALKLMFETWSALGG